MLERGEKVALPPAIWHQGHGDQSTTTRTRSHNFPETEAPRFAANYRKAGGKIELHYFDSDRKPGHGPDLTKIGNMVSFFEH
jgi:acetyl esterase